MVKAAASSFGQLGRPSPLSGVRIRNHGGVWQLSVRLVVAVFRVADRPRVRLTPDRVAFVFAAEHVENVGGGVFGFPGPFLGVGRRVAKLSHAGLLVVCRWSSSV